MPYVNQNLASGRSQRHRLGKHEHRLPAAIQRSIAEFSSVLPHRNPRLFSEFLPEGYRALELSSVDVSYRRKLLHAKTNLGMLITLYDDLADSPKYANPRLLHELYKLPFRAESIRPLRLSAEERKVVDLAKNLADQTFPILLSLPGFAQLSTLLRYDLQQFFNANQYAELLRGIPQAGNPLEAALYTSHNMGLVIVGTMDLMASASFSLGELGTAREVFWLGQRFGRICNVLTTLRRELAEGDVTNELVIAALTAGVVTPQEAQGGLLGADTVEAFRQTLQAERESCLQKIRDYAPRVQGFSIQAYSAGLERVRSLHETLEGVI